MSGSNQVMIDLIDGLIICWLTDVTAGANLSRLLTVTQIKKAGAVCNAAALRSRLGPAPQIMLMDPVRRVSVTRRTSNALEIAL